MFDFLPLRLAFLVQGFFLRIMLVLIFLPQIGQAKPTHKAVLDMLRHAHQQMNLSAANRMHESMEIAASWLHQYCLRYKHFPSDSQEISSAQIELSQLMPNNPYRHPSLPNEQSQATSEFTTDPISIHLDLELGLSEKYLEQVLVELPDDWQAPAGTIKIKSNGSDLILLWAAGADLRPLRNNLGKPNILIDRCGCSSPFLFRGT